MTEVKYTIKQVADIVDNEGLGYAILHYMSADNIKDPKLAELWSKAGSYLGCIDEILDEVRCE